MPLMQPSEPTAEYFRKREEARIQQAKWISGKLRAEYLARKKEREAARREERRRTWPSVMHQGVEYFSIRELAIIRMTSYQSAYEWAKRRPYRCVMCKGHLYCRPEKWPSEGIPPVVMKDGVHYFSIPELARRFGITTTGAYSWAITRPELTMRVGKRLYARDEGYRPRTAPPSLMRDGKEYVTIRELARRRGVRRHTAFVWAKRRPELTIVVNGHLFVRDEPYSARKIPPIHWEGVVPYFSMAELARRRGVGVQAANYWARSHPHLSKKIQGYWYARDEEWKPQHGRPTPHRVPVVSPWLLAAGARRARKR